MIDNSCVDVPNSGVYKGQIQEAVMKKNTQSENNTSLIAKGMEIHGELHFSGILEIEGLVIGNIIAHQDAAAEVRIREAGTVRGVIRAPVVIVNGLVEGDIFSSNHIELASKARVTGNVFYHLMEMVLGCWVKGHLTHMTSAAISQLNPLALPMESQEMDSPQTAGLHNQH